MNLYKHVRVALAVGLAGITCTLGGCSNGSSSSRTPVTRPAAAKNQTALVAQTPIKGFNRLTITVTVCVPGTTNCAAIDNIMVDTGSTGLRLQASALPASLTLPALTYSDGSQLGECYRFGGGNAWGMMSKADILIGGMSAPGMSVQVVSSNLAQQPSDCQPGAATSNGTLGIGINDLDCSATCKMPEDLVGLGVKYQYFSCGTNGCEPIAGTIAPAYQLYNPTAVMDGGIYNGAVLDLPAVPDEGATQVTGTLTFGVNTADNNTMTGASVVALSSGHFNTIYNDASYTKSYIDSGTATYIVPAASALQHCTAPLPTYGLCMPKKLTTYAYLQGTDGSTSKVFFDIGMYPTTGVAEGAAVAASDPTQAFVWGAPFFFGKEVAVVRSGNTPTGIDQAGPLYAWRPTELK